MRWYEYKMETDDLCAPEDLKAKLLAMTDQLTEEEKNQPMMKTPAPARPAPVQRKKPVRFPVKRVGTLAACLAVCAVGYGAFATGMIGLGAKSSSPAVYYSADSTAAAMAAGGVDRAAVDSPMAADYSLNSLSLESSADNGTAVFSEDDAAAAAHSTNHAKIIYTANLSLESKDYDAARAALDAAAAQAGGYMESSSEYSGTEDSRSVSLTFRVPQKNYASFLAAVAEAGNVTYKNQQADDVTAQYMDVEARLENLKAQRTRLQQLQQQAETLSDLLEIESSLTEVQSQIESWQSQMDWYSDQVEQCTVYVSLSEVKTYSPPSESFVSRMADAFASGWQNFAQGVQQLAVFLAGAWPVVVIAAAVAVGGRTGVKSLVALAVTLVCLFSVLLPSLMKGANTLLMTFIVCAYVAVVSLTIVGGVRKKTVCAMLGAVAGTALALLFGLLAQGLTRIDGLRIDDVEPLLQLRQTGTPIGLRGLLVGGIVISALGAVMDVTMGIASSLSEVHAANPELSRRELFRSGMNIGRDMVGTMTNTLILAFLGSGFTLILYLYSLGLSPRQLLSSAYVSLEVVSGVASSVGVILSIPLTALITAEVFTREKKSGKSA